MLSAYSSRLLCLHSWKCSTKYLCNTKMKDAQCFFKIDKHCKKMSEFLYEFLLKCYISATINLKWQSQPVMMAFKISVFFFFFFLNTSGSKAFGINPFAIKINLIHALVYCMIHFFPLQQMSMCRNQWSNYNDNTDISAIYISVNLSHVLCFLG